MIGQNWPMTRQETAPQRLDWSDLAGQIIEDAQVTLNAPFIILSRYDRERQMSVSVGWGGLRSRNVQRALAVARRLVPTYDPIHSETPVALNPFTRAFYLEDRHDIAVVPTFRLIEGAAPPLIAQIAARIAGAGYAAVIPLLVAGSAIGTITCFRPRPETSPQWLATAQAFSRQVSLSIHNAQLLEQQRAAAEALEQSHQLLIQAQDHTRQEISELLHSRVQSRLLVAWHQLGEVQALSPDGQRQLDAVRFALERLREDDVRHLSHQLHPEGLQAGLIPAVQVLASSLAGGLQVQISANSALLAADQPGTLGLPMSIRLVVFRTVEEGLGNVLKHSRVREVQVRLALDGPELHASVTDQGGGFDPQAAASGLGLRLLGARVEASGGQWGLESRSGGPTRLWVQVPLASGSVPESGAREP